MSIGVADFGIIKPADFTRREGELTTNNKGDSDTNAINNRDEGDKFCSSKACKGPEANQLEENKDIKDKLLEILANLVNLIQNLTGKESTQTAETSSSSPTGAQSAQASPGEASSSVTPQERTADATNKKDEAVQILAKVMQDLVKILLKVSQEEGKDEGPQLKENTPSMSGPSEVMVA